MGKVITMPCMPGVTPLKLINIALDNAMALRLSPIDAVDAVSNMVKAANNVELVARLTEAASKRKSKANVLKASEKLNW